MDNIHKKYPWIIILIVTTISLFSISILNEYPTKGSDESNILIALIIFINLLILLSYRYISKLQKECIYKYFKIKEENDELVRSREVINRYVPISMTDLNGNITYINAAMCELTGYSESELLGKNHRVLKSNKKASANFEDMWNTITSNKPWEGSVENISKCGELFWVDLHINPINDAKGNKVGYQATRRDITYQKNLEHISNYDTLTNTYNRKWFNEEINYKIQQFNRYKYIFSIIFIDIDHFKSVNDTHGHQIGDAVLVQCAKIMNKSIRDSDSLVRWGGEEFAVLLINTKEQEAVSVAQKIRKNIEKEEFDIVGNITVSCGVSEVINDDIEQSLFKRVDSRLYQAKEQGRNCVVPNFRED